MKNTRINDFKTEREAYIHAVREKNLEDRLNNLYVLSDRFPDQLEYQREIEELEEELGY